MLRTVRNCFSLYINFYHKWDFIILIVWHLIMHFIIWLFKIDLCYSDFKVQKAIEEENCCFGTIDTWLLHKLTKGKDDLVNLISSSWNLTNRNDLPKNSRSYYFFPSCSLGMLPFGSLPTTCYSKARSILDLLEEDGDFKTVVKPQIYDWGTVLILRPLKFEFSTKSPILQLSITIGNHIVSLHPLPHL